MNIGITSDLHGILPEIEPCEVLCICGDIIPLNIQRSVRKSIRWFSNEFRHWCDKIPAEHIVLIGGNHDFALASYWKQDKGGFYFSDKVTVLENSTKRFIDSNTGEVISIYGTPFCKIFGNWAFMLEGSTLVDIYDKIPEETTILLTHDAPKLNDLGLIRVGNWTGDNAGNPYLADAILAKKPKYAFCGHIHSGNHVLDNITPDTRGANVSLVNEEYKEAYPIKYIII